MTYIEFENNIFPIENVQCVKQFYTWRGDENNKEWFSKIFLMNDIGIQFPEEKYDELKNILVNFNKNKTSLND